MLPRCCYLLDFASASFADFSYEQSLFARKRSLQSSARVGLRSPLLCLKLDNRSCRSLSSDCVGNPFCKKSFVCRLCRAFPDLISKNPRCRWQSRANSGSVCLNATLSSEYLCKCSGFLTARFQIFLKGQQKEASRTARNFFWRRSVVRAESELSQRLWPLFSNIAGGPTALKQNRSGWNRLFGSGFWIFVLSRLKSWWIFAKGFHCWEDGVEY